MAQKRCLDGMINGIISDFFLDRKRTLSGFEYKKYNLLIIKQRGNENEKVNFTNDFIQFLYLYGAETNDT